MVARGTARRRTLRFVHISPARPDDTPLTLIGELRKRVRLRHYSRRTETAYVMWTRRFVRFHHRRHPRTLGSDDVRAFLSDLAIRLQVSASTQNQALAGLLFLSRHVLDAPLPWLEGIERARSPARLPVVLTRSEVAKVLEEMTAAPKLMATLMYGGGLRLMEAVTLRVKDLNLTDGSITIRSGKGRKDRNTVLPERSIGSLREHLAESERLWRADLRDAAFGVELPGVARPQGALCCASMGMVRTRPLSRKPSWPRRTPRASDGASPAIPCGIRSRRIFSRAATISARYRNCWATAMSARR